MSIILVNLYSTVRYFFFFWTNYYFNFHYQAEAHPFPVWNTHFTPSHPKKDINNPFRSNIKQSFPSNPSSDSKSPIKKTDQDFHSETPNHESFDENDDTSSKNPVQQDPVLASIRDGICLKNVWIRGSLVTIEKWRKVKSDQGFCLWNDSHENWSSRKLNDSRILQPKIYCLWFYRNPCFVI